MTVPLFDVKAKLSEYVTLAENGDVIEITKHGKASAVIISFNEYQKMAGNYRPSFIDNLNKWHRRTGGLTQEEYDDFSAGISRNKEIYEPKGDLF